MPRPLLIDFKEDGTVEIDKSVYALSEIEELSRHHGKQYVELLVRLYMYRTPINPYSPEAERFTRGMADMQAKDRRVTFDKTVFKGRVWKEAVARFLTERFDPLVDAFVNYEAKCDEFNTAIATTPVLEITQTKPRNYYKNKYGRKRKGDPVEAELDQELEQESQQPTTHRIDNTDMLSKLNKTLQDYQKGYEDMRQKVLRVKSGKTAIPMRASDLRKQTPIR